MNSGDRTAVRRLLVLDTSYTLEAIRSKRLEDSVTCRDLDGFFDHVWTVHPFASLLTSVSWGPTYGPPVQTALSPRHDFIEGKIGRFTALATIFPLNFLFSQIGVIRALVRLVHDHDITVVRAGDPLLMGLYGWIVARLAGVPLLIRVNGNNERLRRETGHPIMPRFLRTMRVERALERFVLSRADLVAAPNEDNRQFAIAAGARPEHTTIFPYGNLVAPVHFTDPATRADATALLQEFTVGDRPFLLCVGRLQPLKMPDHALRTLAAVRAEGIDAELLMVGNGPMLTELRTLAAELHIADHVHFTLERDQEWLSRVIPKAAVVLSPLTGRALAEVGLAGTPTVAYDLDWQGELVRAGETGELVAARDADAMARATIALLRDPTRARRLGTALREAALQMMDPARLDEHERSEYRRLFAGEFGWRR